MNTELIMWFAGVLLTLGMIKIVWTLFRNIFNKDRINNGIESVSEKIVNSGEKAVYKMKQKSAERKQKKVEENKAIALIR